MADHSLLESYNPLYDVHLRQYFAQAHMQKHLRSLGLLDSNGVPVAQNSTTNNVEGQLYARHQVMMDMMLRNRERVLMQLADLQKKLDAAEKVEIYRRIRSGVTNADEFRRMHLTTRSFSRPARGRARSTDKADRGRRHSNSYDESELMKRIENESESAQSEYQQQHKSLYSRLAANAYKYQYLHKLDDRTLLNYKETLRKQLQKLERFREAAFGPHSVAKHQPNPQTSWFFRRRTSKSAPRQRAGKSMSPPRQRLPPTVLSPQSQPSARPAQPKPKKPSARKLPPIEKSAKKTKTTASSSESRSSAGAQQKLPPTAVIRPSKKLEAKETPEQANRSTSSASGDKLPALGAAAAVGVAAAAGAAGLGLSVSDPEPQPEVSDTDYSRPETEASGGLPSSDAEHTDGTSPQPHSDVEPEQPAEAAAPTPPFDQGEKTPQEEETPQHEETPVLVQLHQQQEVEIPEYQDEPQYEHHEEHHEEHFEEHREQPEHHDEEEEIHVRHTRAIHSEPPAADDFELQPHDETLPSDVEMASPIAELPPPAHHEEARAEHEPSDNEDARSNATHDAESEHHSIDDFNAPDSHRSTHTAEGADENEEHHSVGHETPEPVAANQQHDDYAPTDEHRGASAMSKDSIEALSHTPAHEPDHEEASLHPEHFEPMHTDGDHEEYGYAEQHEDVPAQQLEGHTEEVSYEDYEHDRSMVEAADHEYESDGHHEPAGHQQETEERYKEKVHEQHAESPVHAAAPDSPVQQDLPVHHDDVPISPPESPVERHEYAQQEAEDPVEHHHEEHDEESLDHEHHFEQSEHDAHSVQHDDQSVHHDEHESLPTETPRTDHEEASVGGDVMNQSVYEHRDVYEETAQEAQEHAPPEHEEEMNYEDYEHSPQMVEAADRYVESEVAHSTADEHHSEEKEEHERVKRETLMSQSVYHEQKGAPPTDDHEEVQSMKRYDQHRDSFAESESEPNLHYQTESLQPPAADGHYGGAGTFHELPDEDESMPIMEGDSLRDTDEDDTLGHSLNTQQSEAPRPAQDGDSMTAVDSLRMDSAPPARNVDETFDSMVVQHAADGDTRNFDAQSQPEAPERVEYVAEHQHYGHEAHEDEEHRFHDEEPVHVHEEETPVDEEPKEEAAATRPSTHQSLLVPQPSIEITPASDYGGSQDRLDQVSAAQSTPSPLSNENDDSGHPTALDSAESEYTEDRSHPSTQRDDGSPHPDGSEGGELEREVEEVIPPPVHHSPLSAEHDDEQHEAPLDHETAAFHLPESPNPEAHSTVIPEQHDEEGEALTVPEPEEVVPRDSIPDEYVIDELGLADGQQAEHHEEHESTHAASNNDEDSQYEQPPSTGRTAESGDLHDHDHERQQLSSGYGDEEQTSDVDAYIRAHEHEIHGGNPHDIYDHHRHDPEAEDLMNSNIHAADAMHEAVDAHESHDANQNGVHHHKPTGEDVGMEMHTNGINGNGHHFDTNGFHAEEHHEEHSTASGDQPTDSARTAQTDESHADGPAVRKSVDFGHEHAGSEEEGSDTGSVVIHEDAPAPTNATAVDAATDAEQLTSGGLPG
ncbi:hypothetical protein M3Y99_00137700 [Aphelenchoides fujianensis]|nr:hypothetical protein M3Y99_00137700 [Aphelenchoides fujianensis]